MAETDSRKKILIADDDPGVIALLSSRLQAAGFEVIRSVNGHEALALVKKTPPDLIILDQMMPKVDGVRACALLKADRRFYRIPIIIATASAESSDRELSEKLGANAFVNKPLNMPDLLRRITDLLGAADKDQ